jgi:diguanylate cyclase (GGDEF)-like protein
MSGIGARDGLRRTAALPAGWPRTAAAVLLVLALYGSWQLFRWIPGDRTIVGDLWFVPAGLGAAAAAWSAARRCEHRPRLRSAWRLLALASVIYLAGDVAQTVYELGGSKPYPSVADALYLLFYPATLLALLRFPAPRRDLSERIRLALDLGVVAIGGATVVIYVVLGPTLVQGAPDALQTAFSVAYPVGDMILLVGLGSVLLRGTAASSTRALQLMAAALTLYVIADLIYGYITLHGTYRGGDPVDTLWIVAIGLLTIAAAAQPAPDPDEEPALAPVPRRASWMPYIALALALGLLLWSNRNDPLLPDLALAIAAAVLAALVSLRQFLAQSDLLLTRGQLSHQSLHDALTGLPNRVLVLDRAEWLLARARRNGTPLAALYVDVDGFKRVNDSFGHAAGDQVLAIVAARLSGIVRDADTVGRVGGDDFVVLLEDFSLDAGPELVAERICQVLAQPIELDCVRGPGLSLTASVGIAIGERQSVDELLRDADVALNEAKGGGRSRWTVFDAGMHRAVQNRLALEMDLREALDAGQLFLLYQPIYDLRTEEITGIEALLRWRHPLRGTVSPAVFVPLAEESGEILAIGRWVLRTACEQAAVWRRRHRELGVSVNVSGRQLEHDSLVDDVAQTLLATHLDPAALTLEITETALMRDSISAARRLDRLKALGVRISIDDFGTGYSSLAYLRQFPVDALKIDRSFVSELGSSTGSKALIHTLVQLGQQLGLETLGEGIEALEQLRFLQQERCDLGQGFLFSPPLEAEALEGLLGPGEPPIGARQLGAGYSSAAS